MNEIPELSIIILNWNSLQFLKNCIASIKSETTTVRYEIIVVDGASFDGCGEYLASQHSDVRFFQLQENVGFARANNFGAQQARGKVLLFLNPDTVVLEGAIQKLHSHITNTPRAGVVGAKLMNSDGTIQESCVQSFPTLLNQAIDCDFLRRLFPKLQLWGTRCLAEPVSSPQRVDVVSGACLMISKSVFHQVNGFCEDYFMYSEDVHLSFAVHDSGLHNYIVPNAHLIHYGGGSSNGAPSSFSTITMRESRWKMFRSTRGLTYAELYRMLTAAVAVIRICICAMIRIMPSRVRRKEKWKASYQKWRTILLWSIRSQQS